MRLPDRLRTTEKPRRPPDRDAVGLDAGASDRRCEGDRRAQPDPARERPAAHRRAGQLRTARPTWRRSSATFARSWPRRSLPQGVTASLEGTFQAQEEASRRIGILSLLSLALIFAILYSRYRSAVLALIIMGSVPLALIGSGRGAVDRRSAAVGRLAWSASSRWPASPPATASSRSATTSISRCASDGRSGRELVVRGSLERLTPVLMTALSRGAGAAAAADRRRRARARRSCTRSR